VPIALFAAVASALFYGVAATLESRGAKAAPRTSVASPRILIDALRQVPFLVGVCLSGLGFVAQFFALRSLPVFVVQAMQAGSLAVTAVVAIPVLRARLGRQQWIAVVTVCAGLALLASSAGTESVTRAGLGIRAALLVASTVLTAAGLAADRLAPARRPVVLGTVAGLGFGVVALAARSLAVLTPAHLLLDPAAYALVLGGLAAFGFFTRGLQTGSVTVVTAAVVVCETAAPALIGVLLLGDRTRPGSIPVAVLGFVAAVTGALLLAWLGDPRPVETHAPLEASPRRE
jgi:drug/metabolite transporter (DMT)-like permease